VALRTPVPASVAIEIDWITTKELNDTIRPICVVFVAEAWLRERARAA
jgi:hypothetical protein